MGKKNVKRGSTSKYGVGTLLSIPCNLYDGAVTTENFMDCEVKNENPFNIKGAVSSDYAKKDEGRVVAVVTGESKKDFVYVYFSGEIFSPGNPVKLPLDWVKKYCTVERVLNR
jgi:hypothetical protein